ncbi:hypothetical protein Poli38472_010601 [Pythium oligandrum]|uniref:HotDog ACOT-type domain-containing protein n=1 Tax=Pythium oligandrum TaxID=41045 RepID=A0A8K1C3B6_PYTOL|nr:hypothetical protein Poli38472_010601 [Pythium oligandrum]|eukprot:TMW55719.1 hypothetical protein Poli38472_010601 [Pythium oligandrum]
MTSKVLIEPLRALWRRHQLPATVTPRETRLAFAGLVGDARMKGMLLSMAPVLDMIDLVAGAVSIRMTQGPTATISVDRLDTIRPVFHGDVVRVEGQVINIGQSSMTVQCSGYRLDLDSGQYQESHSALLTMVAVDGLGRSLKGLPKLVDEKNPEYIQQIEVFTKKRRDFVTRRKSELEEVDKLSFVSLNDLQVEEGKTTFVPVKSTELEFCQWYQPKNLNVANVVFGGDVLSWMESAAVSCARKLTKNEHVFLRSTNQVLFQRPVSPLDVVTLRARVCHVRQSELDVEIEVYVTSIVKPTRSKSHSGFFTLVSLSNNHDYDTRKDIPTGLEVNEQDQDEMKLLLKAQKRWLLDREDREVLRLEPLDISHGQDTLMTSRL